jgi:hypothetical protein
MLPNKTKTLSVGRGIYPSDRYRIVRRMMRRISVGYGRCALPTRCFARAGHPDLSSNRFLFPHSFLL